MLQGLFTALVTPMLQNGDIDFISMENMVNYQINNKVNGLVILGSTGEAATLSQDEKLSVIHHVIKINKGRVPLVAGVSQTATKDAMEWVSKLNDIREISYLLVLTPAYVKPTQEGLYQHFAHIAKVSSKPLILYNVPGRTGCNLLDDTAIKLANEHKNIIGLKDATGDISRCEYLVKNKPAHLKIFSGDDASTTEFVLRGGDGAISVTGNIAPGIMSDMINAALKGDPDTAHKLNNQISELHDVLFIESNPIPVKWALYKSALIKSPFLRLPLEVLNNLYHEKLDAALLRLNR